MMGYSRLVQAFSIPCQASGPWLQPAAAFSGYDFWFGLVWYNHWAMRLLWRSQLRKPSVLWSTSHTIHFQQSVSTKSSDPLRILFCGSDNFSIGSLRSLNDERQKDADSIASIDVVCKSPKRVGRDLKNVREGKIQRIRLIF